MGFPFFFFFPPLCLKASTKHLRAINAGAGADEKSFFFLFFPLPFLLDEKFWLTVRRLRDLKYR